MITALDRSTALDFVTVVCQSGGSSPAAGGGGPSGSGSAAQKLAATLSGFIAAEVCGATMERRVPMEGLVTQQSVWAVTLALASVVNSEP